MTGSDRRSTDRPARAGIQTRTAALAVAFAVLTRALVAQAGDTSRDVVAFGGLPADSAEGSLDGLPIRSLELRRLTIFDPVPSGRLAFLYRAANRMHVRTREGPVRAVLTLREGAAFFQEDAAETERDLRALEYVEPELVRVRATRDSVDVLVATRDQWTTQPELNLESGGGKTYGAAGFTERNLAGLGLSLALSFHRDPAGDSRLLALDGGHLFGRGLRIRAHDSDGSAGHGGLFELGQPFERLAQRRAWDAWWSAGAGDVQLFQQGLEAATFRRRLEESHVDVAIGTRDEDGRVRRRSLAFDARDRRFEPSVLQPGADPGFVGGFETLRTRIVSYETRVWKPNYIQRRGVEQFDPIEDFDVGSSLALRVGFSPHALGATADEGYGRVVFDRGAETRRFGFCLLHATAETRVRGEPRQLMGRLEGRWVGQPVRNLTLVAAGLGASIREPLRDDQFVVGGLNGLRAYPVQALAGTGLWRFNTEARWVAARGVRDLVSLGGATFLDAARVWGRGSAAAPWHYDAGFGLRFALPHASQHQIARFDVAWPVSPTRDGRRLPVFSFGSSQAF